jgi:hypothetical protein
MRMQLVLHSHSLRYLFLNIVKINVHTFFVVISLMCVQASPLRRLTKSRLCVVLLEAPGNAQTDVTFLTLCVDASPLPTCGTNTVVYSLGRRGWPVMLIGLIYMKYCR